MRNRFLCCAIVTLALLSGVAAADDIELQLDRGIADKFLSELGYPYQIVVQPGVLASDEGSLGEAEYESSIITDKAKRVELDDMSELSRLAESVLVEELKDPSYLYHAQFAAEPEVKLVEGLLADPDVKDALGKRDDDSLRRAVASYVAKPDPSKYLEAWIKRRVKLEVSWVKLRILTKPESVVSSPIELRKMRMDVQARFKACIKLFGKWRCARFTTPRIKLEARKLAIALSAASPPVLHGHPSFSDLDIVIKIRIFRIPIRIKIGITKIVNKQLRKNGPIELLDLRGMEFEMPNVPGRMVVESITPSAAAGGLLLKATLKVVPK